MTEVLHSILLCVATLALIAVLTFVLTMVWMLLEQVFGWYDWDKWDRRHL